ncbi:hypothetical protein AJ88_31290 [Mesorhizobium amorphae CCBAU 01583]|nr:hypothetical protein AJ88_31290 [Mesorhizobium amorphae CCBAU 01583]
MRFCITKFVTEIELIQSKRLRKRFDTHFSSFCVSYGLSTSMLGSALPSLSRSQFFGVTDGPGTAKKAWAPLRRPGFS